MSCKDVGTTNSDIAGLGILLSFVIQGCLSFLLSVWAVIIDWKMGIFRDSWARGFHSSVSGPRPSLDSSAQKLCNETQNRLKSLRNVIDRLLSTISDAQVLNGIALLVSAIAQADTLDLYHFHIVYDTVNFTGVSVCAAMVVVSRDPSTSLFRMLLVNIFTTLYLAFIAIFGVHLHSWDDDIVGACYHARLMSTSSSYHPLADEIYLAITSLYFFSALSLTQRPQLQKLIINMDRLQGISKEKRLKSWDIGTTLISALVAMTSSPFGISYFDRLFRLLPTSESQELRGKIGQLLIEWPGVVLMKPTNHIKEQFKRQVHLLQNKPLSEHPATFWMQLFLLSILRMAVAPGIALARYWVLVVKMLEENTFMALALAVLQCPVHAYMLFALRASNEKHLSGDSENQWGFGQIVPLVLFVSVATEGSQAAIEYGIQTRATNSKIWKVLGDILANNETITMREAATQTDAQKLGNGSSQASNASSQLS